MNLSRSRILMLALCSVKVIQKKTPTTTCALGCYRIVKLQWILSRWLWTPIVVEVFVESPLAKMISTELVYSHVSLTVSRCRALQ